MSCLSPWTRGCPGRRTKQVTWADERSVWDLHLHLSLSHRRSETPPPEVPLLGPTAPCTMRHRRATCCCHAMQCRRTRAGNGVVMELTKGARRRTHREGIRRVVSRAAATASGSLADVSHQLQFKISVTRTRHEQLGAPRETRGHLCGRSWA